MSNVLTFALQESQKKRERDGKLTWRRKHIQVQEEQSPKQEPMEGHIKIYNNKNVKD